MTMSITFDNIIAVIVVCLAIMYLIKEIFPEDKK